MTRGRVPVRSAVGLVLLVLFTAACSDLSSRQALGPDLAGRAGWRWDSLDAGPFRLAVASAPWRSSPRLVAYLEGDGLAYVDRARPSPNPTPRDPVALRLALVHPPGRGDGNVVWLGRPCQYVWSERCQTADWTLGRYGPDIIAALGIALDRVKARSGAREIALVGYSGGGAVAALLAARRDDVRVIVTIAADLDLGRWTALRRISPLSLSLDPAEEGDRLGRVPQIHFSGGDDAIVGTEVIRSFIARLPPGAPVRLIEIPGFDHACCWVRDWPSLVPVLDWPPSADVSG